MTDFEKLLDDLLQGKCSLTPLRVWLEKNLSQPDCNPKALYEAIDQAQKAGLAQPAAKALCKQIDLVFGVKPQSSDNKEQTKDITATTVTTTQTQPDTLGRTRNTEPDTEQTNTDADHAPTSPIDATDEGTITQGTSGERTIMMNTTGSLSDRTVTETSMNSATDSDEYDPFSSDITSAGDSSQPTRTSLGITADKQTKSSSTKIGPGAVLKERFELVNVLGEGGMGKVYSARDLLKVEAKDKNPFIAVKTLSGDFRQHPEAFMALQREASKAQRLAHPNIATVFDFDRDGTTIYLTMELMEGEELSSYIKRLPAGGLPVSEAMHLIKQLCDGLSYAHSKGLVHSDFKPGNAFITTEGTVKLLDFGIARASKTRRDVTGVTTIFDPSELGALTPAYASLEMFEGDDPDPRDDIYALACVSYELLTGKHPFNKLSAPKVLEKGLKPAPISKLNKRQNRALLNALAITREERTPSVQNFWDGLRPRKSRFLQYGPFVIAALILLSLLGYKPVESYLNTKRNNDIVSQIQSGNVDIPSMLRLISHFDPESQRYILENGKAKIIKYFESQAEAFVDQSRGQYNYPAAFDEISKASNFFPDSAELQQEKSSLQARRASLLAELTKRFNASLTANKIMPSSEGSIIDVIRILRIANPADSLLHDERLTNRYAQLVKKDITSNNYAAADHVLSAGLDYAPNDPELLNLQDQVRVSLRQERDGPRIAELEKLLENAVPNLHTLADFDKVRRTMIELSKLDPKNALLGKLYTPLENSLESALQADIASKQWNLSEKTLFSYSGLLGLDDLLNLRMTLLQDEAHANYVPKNIQIMEQKINTNRSNIEKLLANAQFERNWDNQLISMTKQTAALLPTKDMGWFGELREKIATTYVSLAQKMIKQNRFEAASALISTGKAYARQLPGFVQAEQSLASAELSFKQMQAKRLHLAQIEALENQFQTDLNAGQIDDARKIYITIQNEVPSNDKFITTIAPQAYAIAYLNLAKARASIGDYHGAISLIQGGLQYAPLGSLKSALHAYTAQADRNDLLAMVDSLKPIDVAALKNRLKNVQKLLPEDSVQIADELYRHLARHIIALKTTNLGLANALLNATKSTFPQSVVIRNINLPPAPVLSKFAQLGREAMDKNELSKAEADYKEGQKTQPGNADLAQFGAQLQAAEANASRYFTAYQEYMRAGQTQQAKSYLDEAMRLWVDNPSFQAEFQRNFAASQAPVVSPNGGRPCTADLAGYGKQGRAECYDFLGNGLQGPIMVVIPAGGSFRQPFAIGKYEVSIAQINAYCHSTRQCKPLPGESNMPASNIPFSEVKSYVSWLSNHSKENYFIPSYAQYRYAASVGGTDTNRDFNCRVTLAGQIIKGLSEVNIETGRANVWGLVNYVGNVQEWVLGSDGLETVGGDYRDPLSQCSVNLTRPSDGAANPLTGFRVGRYLDK